MTHGPRHKSTEIIPLYFTSWHVLKCVNTFLEEVW